GDTGPAEQPLESARTVEVHVGGLHVGRYLPDALVPVDKTERALPVRDLGDGLDVLHRAGVVEDVAGRDHGGAVVDRLLPQLERHRRAVGAVDDLYLDTESALCIPLIWNGRKIEAGDDDLPPRRVVERLGDDAEGRAHARMQGDLTVARADDGGVSRAKLRERRPPDLVPGRGAAGLPEVEMLVHPLARPPGQCAEGAAGLLGRCAEDR